VYECLRRMSSIVQRDVPDADRYVKVVTEANDVFTYLKDSKSLSRS